MSGDAGVWGQMPVRDAAVVRECRWSKCSGGRRDDGRGRVNLITVSGSQPIWRPHFDARQRDVSCPCSDVQKDDSYTGRGRVERRRRGT